MQFLRILKILTLALLLSTTSSAIAHPEQAAIDMTDAANAFLATLKPEQKAKATFKKILETEFTGTKELHFPQKPVKKALRLAPTKEVKNLNL